MDEEIVISRSPKPQYQNTNGFNPRFHDEPITERNINDALDRHRIAVHSLETKGRVIPSLLDVQQFAERIETPATMRGRIQELQSEHLEDLRELYSRHAADYNDEAKALYASMDDTQYLQEDERDRQIIESYRRLEQLYQQQQNSLFLNSPLLREYNEMRYAYLRRFLELQEQVQELEKREMASKRAMIGQFPQNTQNFNSSSRETRVRVAKFLLADRPIQELMLDEFDWAWRATQPLLDECKRNPIFVASLRALLMETSRTADPRKNRPSFSVPS